MPNYAHPESLANTQWVADHLTDPQNRFVEIVWGASPSFGMPAYQSGHIPGAVAWDFESDLQNSTRRDVVNKPEMETLLSRSGITAETSIVLYSGLNNLLATFAFWLLKIYGHKVIRLLDGDRQKWLDENRQITSDVPTHNPTRYRAQEPNWSLRASCQDVLQAIRKGGCQLVDTRTIEMYGGLDQAGAARGGHIPGAVNLAARRETNPNGSFKAWRVPTVQADGTFKPVEDLKTIFNNLGVTQNNETITYCVRGGLSTHAWFVLTQLLGYPNVREYERSWAEWGNLEDTPVETS